MDSIDAWAIKESTKHSLRHDFLENEIKQKKLQRSLLRTSICFQPMFWVFFGANKSIIYLLRCLCLVHKINMFFLFGGYDSWLLCVDIGLVKVYVHSKSVIYFTKYLVELNIIPFNIGTCQIIQTNVKFWGLIMKKSAKNKLKRPIYLSRFE